MASQANFFALLDDDENDDPSALIAKIEAASLSDVAPKGAKQQQQKTEPLQRQQPQANFPSKPLPPSQAARGYQSSGPDGNDGRGGRGGRGPFGNNRGRGRAYQGEPRGSDFSDNNNNADAGEFQGNRRGYYGGGRPYYENGDALPSSGDDNQGRRTYDGGRGRGLRGRGQGRSRGFENSGGDSEDSFMRKREYDRRSGTGRGVEMKRNGAGRGNWGTELDPTVVEATPEKEPPVVEEKSLPESVVKKIEEDGVTAEEKTTEEPKEEEKEEAKEMTLDEYEIVLIEKRKALEAMKAQERKVKPDKEFESMQIVNKKQDDDSVMKLVTDNDKGKRKEMLEKEEKARKAMSINEFLKPANGQEYFSPASRRGRGRGRGDRGGFRSGFVEGLDSNSPYHASAPVIEDRSEFPSLLAK